MNSTRNQDPYGDLTDAVPGYALKTAATLHLADHIADGNRSASSLAHAAGAEVGALERLMRYLCHREIFSWSAEFGYHLTPFSRLLLDDHPSQLRRSLDLDGHAGRMDRAIAALPHTIRTGEPSYPALFGNTLYDDYATTPGSEDDFAAVRYRQAHQYGQQLSGHLSLDPAAHIVDVGGSTGALACALVSTLPTVTATVFDVPGLAQTASAAIQAAGLTDRVQFTGGDFFDGVPTGDLHVISNTLFNWADNHAEVILQHCVDASTTGRVAIIEHVLGNNPTEDELSLDLRNLVVTGGRQRTREQFDHLARAVGLKIVNSTPLNYRTVHVLDLVSQAPTN